VFEMAVEVKVLKNSGRKALLRKKWMQMWERLGQRVLKLPEWMQDIVLDDINTAVKNRLAIMEMMQNENRAH